MTAPLFCTPARAIQRDSSITRSPPGAPGDVWIFGYASLIWRPEFEAVEGGRRQCRLAPRARDALAHQPRHPRAPGLVFALVPRRVVAAGAPTGSSSIAVEPGCGASGDARCLPACTTRNGSPVAHRMAASAGSPSRSAGAAQPYRQAARGRTARNLPQRRGALRPHVGATWSRPSGRCAPAASATAMSSDSIATGAPARADR